MWKQELLSRLPAVKFFHSHRVEGASGQNGDKNI
jgi:hypothetical protein